MQGQLKRLVIPFTDGVDDRPFLVGGSYVRNYFVDQNGAFVAYREDPDYLGGMSTGSCTAVGIAQRSTTGLVYRDNPSVGYDYVTVDQASSVTGAANNRFLIASCHLDATAFKIGATTILSNCSSAVDAVQYSSTRRFLVGLATGTNGRIRVAVCQGSTVIQKVTLSTATVSIGTVYYRCQPAIWMSPTTNLPTIAFLASSLTVANDLNICVVRLSNWAGAYTLAQVSVYNHAGSTVVRHHLALTKSYVYHGATRPTQRRAYGTVIPIGSFPTLGTKQYTTLVPGSHPQYSNDRVVMFNHYRDKLYYVLCSALKPVSVFETGRAYSTPRATGTPSRQFYKFPFDGTHFRLPITLRGAETDDDHREVEWAVARISFTDYPTMTLDYRGFAILPGGVPVISRSATRRGEIDSAANNVELFFVEQPNLSTTKMTATTTAWSVSATNYSWKIVLERKLSDGRVIRSAPGQAFTALASATTNHTFRLNINGGAVTKKSGSLQYVAYRYVTADGRYHKCGVKTVGASFSASLYDNYSTTSIADNEILYSDYELENGVLPCNYGVCMVGDRLVFSTPEQGMWYSKPEIQNEIPGFHEILSMPWPAEVGAYTPIALSMNKTYIYVGARNGSYLFSPDFRDSIGNGYHPQKVKTLADVGPGRPHYAVEWSTGVASLCYDAQSPDFYERSLWFFGLEGSKRCNKLGISNKLDCLFHYQQFPTVTATIRVRKQVLLVGGVSIFDSKDTSFRTRDFETFVADNQVLRLNGYPSRYFFGYKETLNEDAPLLSTGYMVQSKFVPVGETFGEEASIIRVLIGFERKFGSLDPRIVTCTVRIHGVGENTSSLFVCSATLTGAVTAVNSHFQVEFKNLVFATGVHLNKFLYLQARVDLNMYEWIDGSIFPYYAILEVNHYPVMSRRFGR